MTSAMKQLLLASAVSLTAIAAPSMAAAQDRDESRGGRFAERMVERFDADGDGAVTLEEYLAEEDRFAGADADSDGFLTQEEIVARAADPRGRMADRMVGRLDTDNDGKVSLDEAKAAAAERAERRFARADADADGFITEEEARSILDERGERRMARRGGGERRNGRNRHHRHHEWRMGRDDDDRGYRGRRGRDYSRYEDDDRDFDDDDRDDRRAEMRERRREMREGREERRAEWRERREERRADRRKRGAEWLAAEMLRIMDTDGDDRISKAESDARIATRFAQLDKDDDGKVVASELQESMQRFGRGYRQYRHF